MTALTARFAALKEQDQKALVAFVTAGDPSLDDLSAVVGAIVDGGADVIEIGIPFSDPIADGPTIQASSQRALDRGVTPEAILQAIPACPIPIVLMGYYNPILAMGRDSFAKRAHAAGVSGVIVSDLTPEYAQDWLAASSEAGLDTVFLAAPTSTDERLDLVCSNSTGFVYAVSRTGVTGAGNEAPADVQDLVTRLKARTKTPVVVGFGISRPEHVRRVCEFADGAVVGSALVELIHREWRGGQGRDALVETIRSLKEATLR